MHYLITGGAGFIGSNLTNALSNEHHVVVIDDLSMGKLENINESDNVTFIKGSVTDKALMEKVLSEHSFDYIFHLAAVASVADSVERPMETHQVNFVSVLNLLDLVQKTQKDLKRLVFSSSAAVYGDEPTLPKHEESVIRPLTPYAIDKFAAEKYVLVYNNLYGIPTSAVRFFNVFGPNQNPESPYSGVISIILDRYERAKRGEESSFTLFGDGKQTRDFVYIEDVLQALLLVATKEEACGQVFNVGTQNKTTLTDLLTYLDELVGIHLPVQYEEERSGDIKDSYADVSKLMGIGYKPNHTVTEGLEKYLKTLGM
ncbi:NAD-dependent epimerase/dehydratase family protein [Vagococcus silagei]|uniref:NAD-dependent epimerase/dehydratase family protein n=1 Tax=Vagococcus silagei TaxID=2508885 RepID=A0A4S3B350_9ENTE|nr:NAD-dependent epimerase/dehydratase family protein [Vagococcus silagei]THB60170.1 NAD-dependent epimerase/dehydratase family protein [Vagococcus silagei]